MSFSLLGACHQNTFCSFSFVLWWFDASPPSAVYMRQWTRPALFQIMACRPLAPRHYLNSCWVIVNWTLRNKLLWFFLIKVQNFHSQKWVWKYRMRNGGRGWGWGMGDGGGGGRWCGGDVGVGVGAGVGNELILIPQDYYTGQGQWAKYFHCEWIIRWDRIRNNFMICIKHSRSLFLFSYMYWIASLLFFMLYDAMTVAWVDILDGFLNGRSL